MKVRQERGESESFHSVCEGDDMILIEEESSSELRKMQSTTHMNVTKNDKELMSSSEGSNEDGGSDVIKLNDANSDSSSVSIEERKANKISLAAKFKEVRRRCGIVANNPYFQMTMILCIFINALMMGIATYPFIKCDDYLESVFSTTDTFFLVVFTIELLMQMTYLGHRLLFDAWLVFDLVIIVMSWAFWKDEEDFQIFRAFRILRGFRLITRVKVMRDLISALTSVFPRMSAIAVMLCLILFIFTVMFTQLWREHSPDTFGTMLTTFLSLCQMMTMDGWAEIAREVMNNGKTHREDLANANVTDFNVTDANATAATVLSRILADATADATAFEAATNASCNETDNETCKDCDPNAPSAHYELSEQLVPALIICFVVISGFIVVNLIIAVICDGIGALDDKEKARVHGYDSNEDEFGQFEVLELREQLDLIEDQIGNLTRIQARTFHTLTYLTRQLQAQKQNRKKPHESKSPPVKSAPDAKNESRPTGLSKKAPPARMEPALKQEQPSDFRETWTQQGSEKRLRGETVVNFAKAANELRKMRQAEKKISTPRFPDESEED